MRLQEDICIFFLYIYIYIYISDVKLIMNYVTIKPTIMFRFLQKNDLPSIFSTQYYKLNVIFVTEV